MGYLPALSLLRLSRGLASGMVGARAAMRANSSAIGLTQGTNQGQEPLRQFD